MIPFALIGIVGLILAYDIIATVRADRRSRDCVWKALDRTIEDRARKAGAP